MNQFQELFEIQHKMEEKEIPYEHKYQAKM